MKRRGPPLLPAVPVLVAMLAVGVKLAWDAYSLACDPACDADAAAAPQRARGSTTRSHPAAATTRPAAPANVAPPVAAPAGPALPIGCMPDAALAGDLNLDDLKDPSRCFYWSRELGLHATPETMRRTLARLAGDAGAVPRAMLIRWVTLAPGEDEPWIELCREAARSDPYRGVRVNAVRALSERAHYATSVAARERLVAAVAEFARTTDCPALRDATIQCLGEHPTSVAAATLADLAVASVATGSAPSTAADAQGLAVTALSAMLRKVGRAKPERAPEYATARETAVRALGGVLRGPAPLETHLAAATGLSSSRFPEAVTQLIQAAEDENASYYMRTDAIRVLAWIQDPAVKPAFERIAAGAGPIQVRAAAAEHLPRPPSGIVPAELQAAAERILSVLVPPAPPPGWVMPAPRTPPAGK